MIAGKLTRIKKRGNYINAHLILNLGSLKFQGFPQTISGKAYLSTKLE